MISTPVLEQRELEAMLAVIDRKCPSGCRNYAMLKLMAQTGMRCGETLQIESSDIDVETWGNNGDRVEVCVLRLRKNTTKGKKERQGLPLTADTMKAVRRWQAVREKLGITDGPLFCTISTRQKTGFADEGITLPGQKLNDRYVRELVRRLAAKAGVTKRVHPHMLRHTALTNLYDKTRDLRLVQVVAGHSSSKTTERYTHVHPMAVAEAMGVLG